MPGREPRGSEARERREAEVARAVDCPRCGRAQPPDAASRYCVHCGRSLSGARWIAHPPGAEVPAGLRRPGSGPPRGRYRGPPAYREIPRWSLWPWAPPAPGPHAPEGADAPAGPPPATRTPAEELRWSAGGVARLAAATGMLAGVAAVAEAWRYGLLLASRGQALSEWPLAFSDALVTLAGLLTPVAAVATGVAFLRWLVRGRRIAADLSGTDPARSTRTVVIGSILPGPNLTVPGSALTEMEHAASGFPPDRRPRPSRPVARWWIAWACSVLLGLLAVLRGLGDSTQALADSVVLHGLTDVAAALTALGTIRMVDHLTELLAPEIRTSGRDHVLAVRPVAAS